METCKIQLRSALGFNLLDENLLTTTGSKCFVAYYFVLMTCSAAITIKNAAVDLVGDVSKQCSTIFLFAGFAQVHFEIFKLPESFPHLAIPQIIGKMLSLFMRRSKLIDLKHRILDDDDATNDESEMRDKKRTRILILAYFVYFNVNVLCILAFPLVSNVEFAMPIYMQFPFIK